MVVLTIVHLEPRDQEVVEPVPARPARPPPADLAPLVAVQSAERIAEPVRLEPAQQRELRPLPLLAAIRSQPSVAVAREAPDGAVGVLAPRRVEIAAEDRRPR